MICLRNLSLLACLVALVSPATRIPHHQAAARQALEPRPPVHRQLSPSVLAALPAEHRQEAGLGQEAPPTLLGVPLDLTSVAVAVLAMLAVDVLIIGAGRLSGAASSRSSSSIWDKELYTKDLAASIQSAIKAVGAIYNQA